MTKGRWTRCFAYRLRLILGVALFSIAAFAQEAQETQQAATEEAQKPDTNASAGDLAKAVQNPVASLISVPIQNNFNPGIGTDDRNQYVLNIQPVIPVQIGENWNLITRVILPFIYQPTQPNQGVLGMGDVNPTFFFSPARVNKLIWGVGPTVVLPTATNRFLGQGKWSLARLSLFSFNRDSGPLERS